MDKATNTKRPQSKIKRFFSIILGILVITILSPLTYMMGKGFRYHKQGRLDLALREYKKWIARLPENNKTKGLYYFNMGLIMKWKLKCLTAEHNDEISSFQAAEQLKINAEAMFLYFKKAAQLGINEDSDKHAGNKPFRPAPQ